MQQLPPYTYVPGHTPHPISDPRGHWHQSARPELGLAEALAWGQELFNRGYYWEAHEVWEGAWNLLNRKGPQADFVKGLIKLAASGVKCLEGNRQVAARHAQRAATLFAVGRPPVSYGTSKNLRSDELIEFANQIKDNPPIADDAARTRAQSSGVPVLRQLP